MMYTAVIEIPGLAHTVTVYSDGGAVTALAFDTEEPDCPDVICQKAKTQLLEYFDGRRRKFSLPYVLSGGDFTRDVLCTLSGIPYGKTMTYGQLARASGHDGAARAAGAVLSKNPLPVIIPCHRILPANGGTGNYFGGRLNDVKKYLLELEGII